MIDALRAELKANAADLTAGLDRALAEVRALAAAHADQHAFLESAHRKMDVILHAVVHILKGHPDMPAIYTQILAALAANDAALIDVGVKAGVVLAAHGDHDAAGNDIFAKVQAQGSAIAALGKRFGDAIPVEPVAPSVVVAPVVEASAIDADPTAQPGIPGAAAL